MSAQPSPSSPPSPRSNPPQPFTGISRLAVAELVLLVMLGLHTVDHGANQPTRELPAGTGLVAAAGFALVALALLLALSRNRSAPIVGVAAGVLTVIGFLAIHLIGFGPVSDPYWDFDANALSWLLLLAPTLAAVAVSVVAVQEMREQPAESPASA